jgi:hypothetical protein
MSEEMLRELASETDEVKTKRAHLQSEADILRAGLSKCQKYRPREMTGAFNTCHAASIWLCTECC